MSVRRILTTHDDKDCACVWMDSEATNVKRPNEWITSTLLWSTDESPADFIKEEDYGARVMGTNPPAQGSRFIMFEVAPGGIGKSHKTDTLDYVIGIEGQMTLLLDDGIEVTINPGDVAVQRGTNHGWANRTSELAKVAIVLLDGKPKRSDALKANENAK